MSSTRILKKALISVYHKDNLDQVINALHKKGVELYSTGGTREFIEALKIPVVPVEDLTGFPSILGGRVKTLHPKIFGGILRRSFVSEDLDTLKKYDIPEFDLLVIDLYPFAETVIQNASENDIIEKIDIGGISLIRAGAKNFNDVLIISHRGQYKELLDIVEKDNATTNVETRKTFAKEAFKISSDYDRLINLYLSGDVSQIKNSASENNYFSLRYGENPHQKAVYRGNPSEAFEQLSGKEISYNNLLDIDSAIRLCSEFEEPVFAILKHNNACGLAVDHDLLKAWEKALAADPVSAFGGVIITNRNLSLEVAKAVNTLFFEVLMAPSFDTEALNLLKSKGNRILLETKHFNIPARQVRTVLNGILEQDTDMLSESKHQMIPVTQKQPGEQEFNDLVFALKIAKHSKSNTIVLAKNGQLLGSGVGMTSRVDALKHAINKAHEFGFNLSGAVMASDAFFPFPDCVEIAASQGITAITQPGGSVKDQLSVEACNFHQISMVFTGFRHFKH